MKTLKYLSSFILMIYYQNSIAQIDAEALFALPILSNTEMNAATTTPNEGSLIYNSDTNRVYEYDGTNWLKLVVEAVTIKEITGNYTLVEGDDGFAINANSGTDIDITVPTGLVTGFKVTVYQTGTGKVTFIESGTTIKNRLSRFRTAGIDAGVGLLSTSTNTFHLTGDLRL